MNWPKNRKSSLQNQASYKTLINVLCCLVKKFNQVLSLMPSIYFHLSQHECTGYLPPVFKRGGKKFLGSFQQVGGLEKIQKLEGTLQISWDVVLRGAGFFLMIMSITFFHLQSSKIVYLSPYNILWYVSILKIFLGSLAVKRGPLTTQFEI